MAALISLDNELYGVPCSFKNRASWFRFPPIFPTTGLVNSPNGLLTLREKRSKMTAEDLQNAKKE